MSYHSGSFQEINGELFKTIENLKNSRDKLDKDIDSMENYREKVLQQLRTFEKELENNEAALQDKIVIFEVYEKILKDSDNAYSQIVNSTQKLYKMVKNEETILTKSKK